MSISSMSKSALLLSLLAPALLSAQSTSNSMPASQSRLGDQRSVVFFANTGGNSDLSNLNDAGTASFNTGWTLGGGVGLQLNRVMAVRGTFDFARSTGDGAAAGTLSGRRIHEYFYGADVQFRHPMSSGFAPYVLLGAGAVSIHPSPATGLDNFTKFAGKGGLGVEYNLRNNVGLFAQGATYTYNYDRGGFDKTQWDLLWTAGLSYRL